MHSSCEHHTDHHETSEQQVCRDGAYTLGRQYQPSIRTGAADPDVEPFAYALTGQQMVPGSATRQALTETSKKEGRVVATIGQASPPIMDMSLLCQQWWRQPSLLSDSTRCAHP